VRANALKERDRQIGERRIGDLAEALSQVVHHDLLMREQATVGGPSIRRIDQLPQDVVTRHPREDPPGAFHRARYSLELRQGEAAPIVRQCFCPLVVSAFELLEQSPPRRHVDAWEAALGCRYLSLAGDAEHPPVDTADLLCQLVLQFGVLDPVHQRQQRPGEERLHLAERMERVRLTHRARPATGRGRRAASEVAACATCPRAGACHAPTLTITRRRSVDLPGLTLARARDAVSAHC
jgi:hypothetical protein